MRGKINVEGGKILRKEKCGSTFIREEWVRFALMPDFYNQQNKIIVIIN